MIVFAAVMTILLTTDKECVSQKPASNIFKDKWIQQTIQSHLLCVSPIHLVCKSSFLKNTLISNFIYH